MCYGYVCWTTKQTSDLHHGVISTVSVRNYVRYSLFILIDMPPNDVLQRVLTHSIDGFAFLAKSYALKKHEMSH